MYIRFQNSCNYILEESSLEIRSDIFNKIFRFKGLPLNLLEKLTQDLQCGIEEKELFVNLSKEYEVYKSKIEQLLSFLKEKKLIINTSDLSTPAPEDTLYDRQVRFLNSFENSDFSGYQLNEKLQNKKVVIIGLGAYGSWLSLHCSRLGIKNIVGIDHDKVELSNLHRQVIYTRVDIGKNKVDACAELIVASDPSIKYENICKKIINEADLFPFLDNADLVFNAFGYYPANEAESMIPGIITRACIKTRTPMLCLSTNWLGPFYLPDISACYFCAVTKPEIEPILRKVQRNARIDKRALAPIIATTCSLAVIEAVCYLSGINKPGTIDGLKFIDPFNIEKSKFIPVIKDVKCKFCSSTI